MFRIVLVPPESPPNTRRVDRLAANTGCELHVIEPLGFSMEDRLLRRAGLDYHELTTVSVHRDWAACIAALGNRRRFALTTRGSVRYTEIEYRAGDVLVFGAETAGLP